MKTILSARFDVGDQVGYTRPDGEIVPATVIQVIFHPYAFGGPILAQDYQPRDYTVTYYVEYNDGSGRASNPSEAQLMPLPAHQ